jgi:hypothetical protein
VFFCSAEEIGRISHTKLSIKMIWENPI